MGKTFNSGDRSLSQRFGLNDPDLTSPAHDALMIWLDDMMPVICDRETPTIERSYYSETQHRIDEIKPKDLDQFDLSNLGDYPLGDERVSLKKIWEVPIINRDYTIGFADMKVIVEKIRDNASVRFNGYTKTIGDVHAGRATIKFWFEVKPFIPSVGELLRQVRLYQNYTDYEKWYVVSPDTKFRQIIENQGIGFIEAPKP